tara:strand:+ start:540 stop:1277 length:738 start_codon:yes stop_codon:yes gene_type:complete
LKKRADLLLVEKKIVSSRSKAQAMIMAGQIYADGKKINKSGEVLKIDAKIDVFELNSEWVSRGAHKLLHAIEFFNINVEGNICLDLGASTGGFSQVLLKNKAKKIFSVDVGTNQLHEKLKNEKKIISIEKTNARYLNQNIINEKIDIIVCDVSFISMKKVLKPCLDFLDKEKGLVIGLIKPQFEASKDEIKKGGIILDPLIHKRICNDFENWFLKDCDMKLLGVTSSPLKGPKGNIEFLIAAKYS